MEMGNLFSVEKTLLDDLLPELRGLILYFSEPRSLLPLQRLGWFPEKEFQPRIHEMCNYRIGKHLIQEIPYYLWSLLSTSVIDYRFAYEFIRVIQSPFLDTKELASVFSDISRSRILVRDIDDTVNVIDHIYNNSRLEHKSRYAFNTVTVLISMYQRFGNYCLYRILTRFIGSVDAISAASVIDPDIEKKIVGIMYGVKANNQRAD